MAQNLKVRWIDMEFFTKTLVNSLGDEPSKKLYLWTAPDAKFPEGRKDDTHLCVEGARTYANLVSTEVAKMKIRLSKHLR